MKIRELKIAISDIQEEIDSLENDKASLLTEIDNIHDDEQLVCDLQDEIDTIELDIEALESEIEALEDELSQKN